MKVLLVSHYPKGGVNTYIKELRKGFELYKIDYECYFYCDELEYDSSLEEERCYIFHFNKPLKNIISIENDIFVTEIENNFREFLKNHSYDVIDFQHFQDIGGSLANIAKEFEIPIVTTLHDYWTICPNLFLVNNSFTLCNGPEEGIKCKKCYPSENNLILDRYNYFQDILINKIDKIITVSKSVAAKIIEEGVPASKIDVIYPALSINQLSKTKKYGENKKVKIGYLGTLDAIKGTHLFLQAFEELKHLNVEFHMYGGGSFFRNIINEYQANDNFFWHGAYTTNELVDLLQEVDCIVIPSVVPETGPLTVQEALRNNIPVIGANIGGIPEYVNEDCGLLFEAGNVKDLVDKIQKVISCPEETLYKWKCRNELLIETKYFIESVMMIYQETVSKKNSSYRNLEYNQESNVHKEHLQYLKGELIVTERQLLYFSIPRVLDLLSKNKFNSVAIFGFGKYGKKISDFLVNLKYDVICFIDNNQNLSNVTYHNKNIYTPQKVKELELEIDLIIIVADREKEIIEQLMREGCSYKFVGLREIYKQLMDK